jgi:rhodanese-related sulfurtransferase
MKKKIQIIMLIIILFSTSFVGITAGDKYTETQSLKQLSYYPESHDFGDMLKGQSNITTFEIWNSGCCYLYYELFEDEEWIEVDPTEGGSTYDEHNTITVSINTTNLTYGLHEGKINIISNGGEGNFTVIVNVLYDNLIDITVEEAWDLLNDTSNGIQIPIDVRTDDEWKNEHIDTPIPENPKHHNYLNWYDPDILQDFISTYDGQQIIVYCKSGGRSKAAATMLVDNEFNGVVYNMLGGITEWKNQGYPTDGYTTFQIMNFQPNIGSVSIDIKNNGSFTAKNISVEIQVTGGYLSYINLISTCTDCEKPLEPNGTKTESTIKDGFIFGFGPIEITVSVWAKNADKITVKEEGFAFGFFISIN